MTARSPRALLLLPLLLCLLLPAAAPPAAACHVGSWEHGPTHRRALVTSSALNVGLYARERVAWQNEPGSFGCEEMSWRDRCTMQVGPFLLVAPDRPECLPGPWDFGVYVNGATVGTETLP